MLSHSSPSGSSSIQRPPRYPRNTSLTLDPESSTRLLRGPCVHCMLARQGVRSRSDNESHHDISCLSPPQSVEEGNHRDRRQRTTERAKPSQSLVEDPAVPGAGDSATNLNTLLKTMIVSCDEYVVMNMKGESLMLRVKLAFVSS